MHANEVEQNAYYAHASVQSTLCWHYKVLVLTRGCVALAAVQVLCCTTKCLFLHDKPLCAGTTRFLTWYYKPLCTDGLQGEWRANEIL